MHDSAPSAFTRELIDELSNDSFRLHAWRRFMSRSWARSLDDIAQSPSLVRSFLLSAGTFLLIGSSLLLLSWRYQSDLVAFRSLAYWLPWYAAAVVFVLTHLGMADSGEGPRQQRFVASNQLSFMRLALAPLVLMPGLAIPVYPVTGPVFAFFIVLMSLSDGLDGWLARRGDGGTRLGQMLDYLADLSFLTFLAVGLYLAGAISGLLLWLLVARYPLTILAALILYFAKGPAPLSPTVIGRVTTLAVNIVLLVIALKILLNADWLASPWLGWAVSGLYWLLGANIVYLVYCGVRWNRHQKEGS